MLCLLIVIQTIRRIINFKWALYGQSPEYFLKLHSFISQYFCRQGDAFFF